MPTLLPRESMNANSVIPAPIQRPALLLFENSRPRVTTTPLPHATGAYGQLPGRDFTPLDLLLLLRTDITKYSICRIIVYPCCYSRKNSLAIRVGITGIPHVCHQRIVMCIKELLSDDCLCL